MRHFLPADAIARLACGVVEPAAAAVLIPSAGRPQRGLPRALCARLGAIAVTAIAVTTQEKDAPAVDACADDKTKRV